MSMDDRTDEVLAAIHANIPRALVAMGMTAVELTVMQMETGYGAPIRDSGNLIGSIKAGDPEGDTITIGTNVEYAEFVHYGTWKMTERPFMTDALENDIAQAAIEEVAA